MTIKIEDIQKVDFDKTQNELELIQALTEKINILSEYVKNLRIQIIAADGYKIKILDLREEDIENGN